MTQSDLLQELKESFSSRRGHFDSEVWQRITSFFPLSEEAMELPPAALSSTMDLGLQILWIVQRTLVRGIAAECGLPDLPLESIGAMAHGDDPDNPVVAKKEKGQWTLSGIKKYITGGASANILYVTARDTADGKSEYLFSIPVEDLPDKALAPIELPALQTVPHGRLTLNGLRTAPPAVSDGSHLRKALARWSLMERAGIVQALLDTAVSLCQIETNPHQESFRNAATEWRSVTAEAFEALHSGQGIALPLKDIFSLPWKDIIEAAASSDEMIAQVKNDIRFTLSLSGMKV